MWKGKGERLKEKRRKKGERVGDMGEAPLLSHACCRLFPAHTNSKLNTKAQLKNSQSFYMIITVIITGP